MTAGQDYRISLRDDVATVLTTAGEAIGFARSLARGRKWVATSADNRPVGEFATLSGATSQIYAGWEATRDSRPSSPDALREAPPLEIGDRG